ncbi:MAG: efflux transporter outer membrane subunit [Bdellovibrionota bacterium]
MYKYPNQRYKLSTVAACLILVLQISGCSIGPDYKNPEISLPEKFTNIPVSSPNKIQQEQLWWQAFQDKTLDNLIEEGVKANLEVQRALTRINQSRALANEAFAELFPTGILNGSYVKAEDSGSRFPVGGKFGYQVYSLSVDAAWEIDLFGRHRREYESRNAEYEQQIAELHNAQTIIISEIASTYFQLRANQLQLKIAQENEALQKSTVDLVNQKVGFGLISELDLARAEAQLAKLRASLPNLEAAVKINIHRLAVILGRQPTSLYKDFDKVRELPDFNGPMEIKTPAELLKQRPDIKSAERRLAADTARIGVAVGEFFPKVKILGSLGIDAVKFSKLSPNNSFYSFGPSISWSPLDSGRLLSQVTFRKQAAKESLLAYNQTVLTALEEVENALVKYSAENKRRIQLAIAEKSAKRAYKIADDQYREGTLDFTSVLDTQRSLLDSQSEVVESKKLLSLALVDIYKAFGGGWEAWDLKSK